MPYGTYCLRQHYKQIVYQSLTHKMDYSMDTVKCQPLKSNCIVSYLQNKCLIILLLINLT
jgi:hypothetical protein